MSPEQVEKMIKSASSATCTLDPIPTWILKQCFQELLPTITRMVNLSLASGEFPQMTKKALIKPLIKKQSLDTGDYTTPRQLAMIYIL